jgi:membrane protein implicated in regulation of membrane protease activity
VEIFPKRVIKTSLKEGYVTSTVLPNKVWRVQFESTEWFARNIDSGDFKIGDCVQVVGKFDATTLLIEAVQHV